MSHFVWKLTKNMENENKHSFYSVGESFLQEIEANKISIDEKIQFNSTFLITAGSGS
jgi:hypothetical protein